MFRILSLIIIISSFIWLYRLWGKKGFSFSRVSSLYWASFKNSFKIFRKTDEENTSDKLISIRRFFYLSTLLLFILMFLSAYIPIILGSSLTGLFLLVHVTIAPLFSVFLAVLIVLTAHSNGFNKTDFVNSVNDSKNRFNTGFNLSGYSKFTFWLIVLFSIPTMVSIILGMFPLFGTEGQIYLLNLHRYSTLILLVLVIIHSGIFIIQSESKI